MADEGAAEKSPVALTRADYARHAHKTDVQLERECEVRAFHATGPGGQCVNTTDSAVRMRHLPTGIVVVSRESRSQLQNRQRCLAKLRAILERRAQPEKHRTPTKATRASHERRLHAKRLAADKKRLRGRVRGEE